MLWWLLGGVCLLAAAGFAGLYKLVSSSSIK